MPDISISLNDDLINAGQAYAKAHNTSLNELIRKFLEQTVQPQSAPWIDDCFRLMDKAGGNSEGRRLSREDLYDV